jgi:hypothetical protein
VPKPLPASRWALTPPFHPYLMRLAPVRRFTFLWHFPRGFPHRALPGILPCGARTFLSGRNPSERLLLSNGRTLTPAIGPCNVRPPKLGEQGVEGSRGRGVEGSSNRWAARQRNRWAPRQRRRAARQRRRRAPRQRSRRAPRQRSRWAPRQRSRWAPRQRSVMRRSYSSDPASAPLFADPSAGWPLGPSAPRPLESRRAENQNAVHGDPRTAR